MHNLVIHKWIKVTSYMTHSGYTKLYQGAHNLLQIMQKCINLFYICLFFSNVTMGINANIFKIETISSIE